MVTTLPTASAFALRASADRSWREGAERENIDANTPLDSGFRRRDLAASDRGACARRVSGQTRQARHSLSARWTDRPARPLRRAETVGGVEAAGRRREPRRRLGHPRLRIRA